MGKVINNIANGGGIDLAALKPARNALLTVVCGNSLSQRSFGIGGNTYGVSIVHWANVFAGSPFRFRPIVKGALTSTDDYGTYGLIGGMLSAITAGLQVNFLDPINAARISPECVLGVGLVENDLSAGTLTIDGLKSEFNKWRRTIHTMWPGVLIVTHTPLPSFANDTPTKVKLYKEFSAWLLTQDDGASLLVWDGQVYEDPVNPAKPLPGFTDDTVHPNPTGGSTLGRVFAAAMSRIATKWKQPGKLLSANPALSGSIPVTGTDCTGTMASGTYISGSVNGPSVGLAEQPGQVVTIVANSTAGPNLLDVGYFSTQQTPISHDLFSAFTEIEIISGADKINDLWVTTALVTATGYVVVSYYLWAGILPGKVMVKNGDILTFVTLPTLATTANHTSGAYPVVTIRPILAGGSVSYRVRKAGVIAIPTAYQNRDYAASITPDIDLGKSINIKTLTGNIAINAPVNGKTGDVITFNFVSDATVGRTITYNAAFKSSAVPASTASAKASHQFSFDGTHWVQVGGPLVWL